MIDNATEWLASVVADIAAIDLNEWGAFVAGALAETPPEVLAAALAATVAVACLLLVVHKEYRQKGRLQAPLDRITFLRVPPNARDEVIHDALLDDLLSPAPSPRATATAQNSQAVGAAVAEGNRDKVSSALLERIRKHGQIDYFPPPDVLEKYFLDRRFCNNFYTPVIVANIGRKTVHLSSLVLVARSTETKAVWAFTALVTVDPLKVLDRTDHQGDLWRAKGQFIGATVEPFGSVEIHPWFVPITDHSSKKIAGGSMPPGDYRMRITGYGAEKKRLFSTNWADFPLTREMLIQAFGGGDSAGNLLVDTHIDDALRDV